MIKFIREKIRKNPRRWMCLLAKTAGDKFNIDDMLKIFWSQWWSPLRITSVKTLCGHFNKTARHHTQRMSVKTGAMIIFHDFGSNKYGLPAPQIFILWTFLYNPLLKTSLRYMYVVANFLRELKSDTAREIFWSNEKIVIAEMSYNQGNNRIIEKYYRKCWPLKAYSSSILASNSEQSWRL